MADALADGGAHVKRNSPLLPDLTEAAMLHMQLMVAGIDARVDVEAYEQLRTNAAAPAADDGSLDAAWARGIVCSHREWIEANDHREQLRQHWRALFAEFDAVVCPVMPTVAFPHDHTSDRRKRHRRRRLPLQRSDGVGRFGHHTRPAGHCHTHGTVD